MIGILFSLYLLTHTSAVQQARNFRLLIGQNNLTTATDLTNITPPSKGSVIYIEGFTDNYSSLVIAHGGINNLIFNDESLKTVLNPQKINRDEPYMILDYKPVTGNLRLVEKSSR